MLGAMRTQDVLVVGGGVIGCATAFALARRGARVALLERDAVGRHASSAAAGMLAPLAESTGKGPVFELGVRALDLLPELVEQVRERSGIDPLLRRTGVLRPAAPAEAGELRARVALLAAHGCRWLERSELREREPRLVDGFDGALWSPLEAHVESALLTRGCAAAARAHGAELVEGAEVLELHAEAGGAWRARTADASWSAGQVVLCTGAWAPALSGPLGAALPIEPVKGQMLALALPGAPLRSIVWGKGIYLVPRADGTLAVGATVEHAGFDPEPSAEGVAWLLASARELLPPLGAAHFLRAWAGLRPGSPDGLPLVGPLPGAPGAWIAAGHHRNGVLLSALTAHAVADWLLAGERWPELDVLDPARFAR